MIDIAGFTMTTETLITTLGVAIFTAMAVSSLIKPVLTARGIEKGDHRYPITINFSALIVAELFSISGLIIAQLALDSVSTIFMALARGFAAAFFATGGYEAYSSILKFAAGRNAN